MNTIKQKINTHIRWMIRRDMPDVLAIEQQCFQFPWREDDFIRCLRNLNCIGMICEAMERNVGFMIYELFRHKLHLLNFAVHEDCRYRGFGRAMIAKLIGKLSRDRRSRIELEVRESNLDAQLFFKAMGFRCVGTMPAHCEDCDEDAYRFRYCVDWSAPDDDDPKDDPWQDDGEPIA
jgi:ribosomal-protein-alanine N-acetyltransferase